MTPTDSGLGDTTNEGGATMANLVVTQLVHFGKVIPPRDDELVLAVRPTERWGWNAGEAVVLLSQDRHEAMKGQIRTLTASLEQLRQTNRDNAITLAAYDHQHNALRLDVALLVRKWRAATDALEQIQED